MFNVETEQILNFEKVRKHCHVCVPLLQRVTNFSDILFVTVYDRFQNTLFEQTCDNDQDISFENFIS